MELTKPQLRALRTVLENARIDKEDLFWEISGNPERRIAKSTQIKAIDRWLRLIDKQISKQEETECSSDCTRS